MGLQNFQIEILNKSVHSYFPGEAVEGIVHVVTDEEKTTEGIHLTFQGKARVRWTDNTHSHGSTRNSAATTVTYSAEEQYMYQRVYLFGTGGMQVVLPAGHHQFPFKFTLPLGLPTTFDHPYGNITYEMKAEMQRSWLINHKAKVPFAVSGILDLNVEPGASQPIQMSKYKTLCCFCCKSGPIGFILKIPRTGYVSGEFMEFNGEFSNQSNRLVNGVAASLVQTITFHAHGRSQSIASTILTVQGPGVRSGDSENWSGNVFQIPPLLPTRLASSRIIDVQYSIKMEMDVAGPSINLRQEIPVIIGNIPLRNINSQESIGFQPIMNQTSAFSNIPENILYPALPPVHNDHQKPSTEFQPTQHTGYSHPYNSQSASNVSTVNQNSAFTYNHAHLNVIPEPSAPPSEWS